jgi:hypothetical protein
MTGVFVLSILKFGRKMTSVTTCVSGNRLFFSLEPAPRALASKLTDVAKAFDSLLGSKEKAPPDGETLFFGRPHGAMAEPVPHI